MGSCTEKEFTLTSCKKQRAPKRYWLPDTLEQLEVTLPTEECITITVVLRIDRTLVHVPVAWSPMTEQLKKLHRDSWTKLGITRDELFRIKERIIRLARKEHERRAKRFATFDLFPER